MLSLIISLCTLASLFCLAGGARMLRSLLRAPEGYEDEAGFHQAQDPAGEMGLVARDLGRTSLHV